MNTLVTIALLIAMTVASDWIFNEICQRVRGIR